MVISKAFLLAVIQEMPDKFSIDELLDKLLLLQKLEIAIEQSKRNEGMSLEEARKHHEKWLK